LGKKFDITDEMLLGRAENAHIRINEENVSRLHAMIYKKKGEILIEDQNSTNGTFVNTRKVKSKTLRDGDLILIGNTIMKFMSGSMVENEYHEEIYRLATMDGLTRVYNKSFFMERLSDEFSRSKRYDRDLSLLFFDFDFFKRVNDTYGHLAGDEVLKQATALVMKNLRKEDIFGRYGGEEFGIVLPETQAPNATQLAEKLRKLVEKTPFSYQDKLIGVTVSFGVATIHKNVQNVSQLLDLADKALYVAKKSGRNCVKP
jgi:diguanylate cyclase (GGDEF)-like protein